ncbi:PH domain-containing protein [Blastococcus sp. SYSU D00922]
MADANWLPDPTGMHELRYWNGSAWTEHVSDQGSTGQDPLTTELPPPAAAFPPPPGPPPAAAAPAGGKVSWKDRLKQVADQGKAIADQGKQKLAEQNAKRTEQWANDPSTLWFGESKNAATSAAGVSKARYRITKDRVWIESGLLGTRTESVPLWAVKDMDVRQAVWQRGNDVGDVVLVLEDPSYGAQADMFNLSGNVEGTTTGQVVLDNVEGPYAVMDLLAPLISEARQKKTIERQSQYLHVNPGMAGAAFGAPAPAAPPPAAPPQTDMVEQLRKLGELRDAGILTEEEFAAQKARILAG